MIEPVDTLPETDVDWSSEVVTLARSSKSSSRSKDPLPAAAGLAVLEVIARERLVERAAELGERLGAGLRDLMQRHEVIGDLRGTGLMWGVEIVRDRKTREPDHELGARITERCLELGLSMNISGYRSAASVWRIAPPLTVAEAELDEGLAILDQSIGECLADQR